MANAAPTLGEYRICCTECFAKVTQFRQLLLVTLSRPHSRAKDKLRQYMNASEEPSVCSHRGIEDQTK